MANPMTQEGAAALRAELRYRKTELRHDISRAIGVAREHGDLRENAEYHAAKEQQGFNEGRIAEIEGRLADARIIDITSIPPQGKVIFGATITLLSTQSDEPVRYKIVGADEADVQSGKISFLSPIARALIGRAVGDEVTVDTPSGKVTYEVDDIAHI